MIISGLICAVLFLVKSELCKQLFAEALRMCCRSIVPSLFPLIVSSSMIFRAAYGTDPQKKLRLSYLFGFIFGYPLNATLAARMYESGEIGKRTYLRLTCCGGAPSIGFVIGVCGGRFGFKRAITLYFISIFSALLCGMMIGAEEHGEAKYRAEKSTALSISQTVSDSIKEGFFRVLGICGYVIYFYILSGVVCSSIRSPYALALIGGILEFGSGCIRSFALNEEISYVFCAFILSFSGLSVAMQCSSAASDVGAPSVAFEYILFHTAQGILSASIAAICCKCLGRQSLLLIAASAAAIGFVLFLQRINKNKLKEAAKSSIMNHR